jgi:serine/threonine protein kinase/Tol biopolymer transport system component
MALATGTHIGPYEIVGWLGAGGMGNVYRARDRRLAREVAIKVIPETFAADPSRVRRFEVEARAAGQLNHPNLLTVYDVGVEAGTPYIVAELLDGESLRSRVVRGALPWREAADYARQIAEGLAAAHDKHIVHRDVKPENVFLTSDGRIKVLDFGLAKLALPSEQAPSDHPPVHTETRPGVVLGTAAYMSPEQVRGETLDARSDLFSVGTILYEMLSGRPAFVRPTAAETIAAVLKEDPPLTANMPAALARIVSRCLEKTPERRFQSARDLAFGLEVVSETGNSPVVGTAATRLRRSNAALAAALVALGLLIAVASWLARPTSPSVENPLANASFTRLTDWDGEEVLAEMSPDGRFVAFLADRDGEFDIWLGQIGTNVFRNLTNEIPAMSPPGGVLRNFGFSGDGAEIWFSLSGRPGDRKMLMPLLGGSSRAFLGEGDATPSWSPDGTRLAYFNNREGGGDPVFVADRTGAEARRLVPPEEGVLHNHNPVWSPDGEWIYFVRGRSDPTGRMEVWRVRSSGGAPELLIEQHANVNYLAPLDQHTLLYVARAADDSGPWLWALDTLTKAARRVTSGLERYTSVAASRDGRRAVATIADPTSSIWTVPILDRPAEERAVKPYAMTAARAFAPRFGGKSFFYLSARGTGVGVWRVDDGQASEVWQDASRPVSDPPAVSADGLRLAVAIRQGDKRRLAVMSADGTNLQTLTTSIDVEGAPGAGPVDWSPDGAWIVMGGRDATGPGLFKIPVDGGEPIRLVAGHAVNPVWSPDGNLIVYAGPFVNGQVPLLGVRPDGTRITLPPVRVREGAYRFLPDGSGLLYRPMVRSLDFWLLDLTTGHSRQLTHLGDRGQLRTFDVTPDGKQIVFDRSRENSDIVMIDLPR